MAIFNSFLYVYQRVPWGFPMMKHHSAMTSIMAVVMKCNESYIPWICVNMMGRPGDAGKTIYLRHACTLEPCHVASGTRECQSDVAHEPANQHLPFSTDSSDSVCSLIWITTTLFSQPPKKQGRWSQVTDTAQLCPAFSSSQDIWCTMSALRSSHQGGVG